LVNIPTGGDKGKTMTTKWIKNWFSNMERMENPLVAQGIKYWSVENFFQAMKTQNLSERRKIASMDPHKAKSYARKIPLRSDWEAIKLAVMRHAISFKFQKGTVWHTRLIREPRPIIEINNWHDNFWGNCICLKCEDKPGLNWLGKLIEEHR
jgi:predicted NAD-dependent protein-ADP-ribosyltransferase YbiA (DUF1768 family)